MRVVCILTVALVLGGCSSAPVARVPEFVNVPVRVGCLGDFPERPVNTFNQGAWPGDAEAAKAALVDAAAWEAYALKLEVAQAGCEKKSSASMQ